MSDPAITYRGVVYPWQCDHVGHMNVMWYTHMFDAATWTFFASFGLTPSYFRDAGRGMAAVEARTTYAKELLPGDVVTVRSALLEVRARVLRFAHEMIHDETQQLAARCDYTSVHLDRTLRRATPFPDEVVARARALVVPTPGQYRPA